MNRWLNKMRRTTSDQVHSAMFTEDAGQVDEEVVNNVVEETKNKVSHMSAEQKSELRKKIARNMRYVIP